MVLVLGAALAIVSALVFVAWESGRATFRVDEDVDLVAESAPIVSGVRQEPVLAEQRPAPPLQEVRTPAATIVEMPVQGAEKPEARPASGVVRGANARALHGATVRGSPARSPSKRGGDSKADFAHSAPQVRRLPAITKDVEERVDADVQVIEAIVTRSR
ncbi:MAG: hypothetical protein AzoDbin1_02040 [Azoarcus sp.]|uniref:Uncharacterized protein n=1 Tax=Aromatoleum tolulyticum TaxID=34027 RepID=A0A1N6VD73_9RHOO|nr:hypothetical protein [Aromatoleum tolulyticum]MCK9985568.1 hypothetical protein [Azoarcus sp.]SIQ75791.1 hypothetical protein SAMN05421829_106244 [Aromatoleum tolulyticum]